MASQGIRKEKRSLWTAPTEHQPNLQQQMSHALRHGRAPGGHERCGSPSGKAFLELMTPLRMNAATFRTYWACLRLASMVVFETRSPKIRADLHRIQEGQQGVDLSALYGHTFHRHFKHSNLNVSSAASSAEVSVWALKPWLNDHYGGGGGADMLPFRGDVVRGQTPGASWRREAFCRARLALNYRLTARGIT